MQIKTTIRYHLTSVKTCIIKKSTNNKYWLGYGEKGILVHCWWECKLVQPLLNVLHRFVLSPHCRTYFTDQLLTSAAEPCILKQVVQRVRNGPQVREGSPAQHMEGRREWKETGYSSRRQRRKRRRTVPRKRDMGIKRGGFFFRTGLFHHFSG